MRSNRPIDLLLAFLRDKYNMILTIPTGIRQALIPKLITTAV